VGVCTSTAILKRLKLLYPWLKLFGVYEQDRLVDGLVDSFMVGGNMDG
jgi:hypothetical protein